MNSQPPRIALALLYRLAHRNEPLAGDPEVAEWLMDRALGPKKITLGSPVEGVGGLGMMMLGLLLSTVVPQVWWFVFGGILSGMVLGTTMAIRRRDRPLT